MARCAGCGKIATRARSILATVLVIKPATPIVTFCRGARNSGPRIPVERRAECRFADASRAKAAQAGFRQRFATSGTFFCRSFPGASAHDAVEMTATSFRLVLTEHAGERSNCAEERWAMKGSDVSNSRQPH